MLPVVAALGTVATIAAALQDVIEAETPLNVTVLVFWVIPKSFPTIVTLELVAPENGANSAMLGWVITVKETPLLGMPATDTITKPEAAPAGTGTTIEPALHDVGVATSPLNVTMPAPCDVPKLLPLMVTGVLAVPDVIDSPVI